MKILKSSLLITFVAIAVYSCNSKKSENQNTQIAVSEDIQVYYFHNTKRCATCNAVEDETKLALEMFYKKNMEAGTLDFISLNLEEEKGKEIAKSLNIAVQTLLIVKGESQVNLTNEGFMNARSNPTRFHEIIKTQIDKLL